MIPIIPYILIEYIIISLNVPKIIPYILIEYIIISLNVPKIIPYILIEYIIISLNVPKWEGFKYIPTYPEGYCEKIEMQWISLDEIKEAIISNNKDKLYRDSFLASMSVIVPYLEKCD